MRKLIKVNIHGYNLEIFENQLGDELDNSE